MHVPKAQKKVSDQVIFSASVLIPIVKLPHQFVGNIRNKDMHAIDHLIRKIFLINWPSSPACSLLLYTHRIIS